MKNKFLRMVMFSAAKTVDPAKPLNYMGRSDAPIAQLVEQLTFNQ